MFGKLRNKLKSLLGKKEDLAETLKEETKKDKKIKEKVSTLKKKGTKTKDQVPSKRDLEDNKDLDLIKKTKEQLQPSKDKDLKNKEPEPSDRDLTITKDLPTTKTTKKELPTDEELKELAENLEEVPKSFNIGQEQFLPDTEKIKKAQKKSIEVVEDKVEKKGFFSRFISKVKTSTLNQDHVNEIFDPIEIILLENNVALEVVDKIKENLSKDLVGIEVKKGNIEDTIITSLKESIESVLIEPPNLIENIKSYKGVYTIIFFGINGTGKTTSIAKLAHKLKENNISCVLAAGDTFRAASIEQLETHSKKLNVPIIKSEYNADPTSVAFDAKKYAQKNNIKCVLIDTAGRMYTKENLIKQMEKIIRVIKPELKIFVGESTTGNDCIEQVKTFDSAVGIDGIILSKADVDEKGGTALSVSYVTKKPIYFLGVGQNYQDLQEFKKSTIMKNLGLD